MILAEARRPDSEALPLAHQSEAWLNQYLAGGNVDESEKTQVVIVGINVANWYGIKDHIELALLLLRRTVDIARATNQPRQAGAAQIVAARTLRSAGDLEGALVAIREAVVLLEVKPGDTDNQRQLIYGLALVTEGEILGEDGEISMGRSDEAVDFLERGFRIACDLARQDASDTVFRAAALSRGTRLAEVLRHSDPRRAVEIYDEALRNSEGIKNNAKARRQEVRTLAGSTYPLRSLGRIAEARARLDLAFSRLRDLKLYPAESIEPLSEPDDALRALADCEAASGAVARALELYQELAAKIMKSKPKIETSLQAATGVSSLYQAMAPLFRRTGQPHAADALDAQRLEIWRGWERKLPNNSFVLRQIAAPPTH